MELVVAREGDGVGMKNAMFRNTRLPAERERDGAEVGRCESSSTLP